MQDRETTVCITSSGDETWIYHFTPTSKQPIMEWKHPGSPRKQYKVTLTAGKVLATVFLYSTCVLLVQFMEHGLTVNRLCNMLQRSWEAIKCKHPCLPGKGVILLMTLSYCTQHKRSGTCCKILGEKWTFPNSVQIWHPLTLSVSHCVSRHCFTCGKAIRHATIM